MALKESMKCVTASALLRLGRVLSVILISKNDRRCLVAAESSTPP